MREWKKYGFQIYVVNVDRKRGMVSGKMFNLILRLKFMNIMITW